MVRRAVGPLVVAAVLALGGCSGEEKSDNGLPSASGTTIKDPVGDTTLYNKADRPSKVTVNVDVEQVGYQYDESGLVVVVDYAEPLDPGTDETPELLVDFNGYTLWWLDGVGRPYVTGEDEIRTACRVPAADVDRDAGRVVLTLPARRHCLGTEPPPDLTVDVTAYYDDTWDLTESDVSVELQ